LRKRMIFAIFTAGFFDLRKQQLLPRSSPFLLRA